MLTICKKSYFRTNEIREGELLNIMDNADKETQTNALRNHFKKIQNNSPLIGTVSNLKDGICDEDNIKIKMPNLFDIDENKDLKKGINDVVFPLNRIAEILIDSKMKTENYCSNQFSFGHIATNKGFKNLCNEDKNHKEIDIELKTDEIESNKISLQDEFKFNMLKVENRYLLRENEQLKDEIKSLRRELSLNNQLIRAIIFRL